MITTRQPTNRTWIPVLTTSICALAAILFFWTRAAAQPEVEVTKASSAELAASDFDQRAEAVRERLSNLRARLDAQTAEAPSKPEKKPQPQKKPPRVKQPQPEPRPDFTPSEECKRSPLCKR
jgi:outer membrane biosynthesis protein TonB